MKYATDAIEPYKDGSRGFPDAAFLFQLPDEIYSGSNLYAVQKHYDGPFQFDVFFESAKQELSCKHMPIYTSAGNVFYKPCVQLPSWTKASRHCLRPTTSALMRCFLSRQAMNTLIRHLSGPFPRLSLQTSSAVSAISTVPLSWIEVSRTSGIRTTRVTRTNHLERKRGRPWLSQKGF